MAQAIPAQIGGQPVLILREGSIHGGGLIGCLLIWLMLKMGIGWFWIFGLGALGLSGVSFVLKKE